VVPPPDGSSGSGTDGTLGVLTSTMSAGFVVRVRIVTGLPSETISGIETWSTMWVSCTPATSVLILSRGWVAGSGTANRLCSVGSPVERPRIVPAACAARSAVVSRGRGVVADRRAYGAVPRELAGRRDERELVAGHVRGSDPVARTMLTTPSR
jgi:hypothetical protein